MMKRKYIYITLAAILLASSVIAAGYYWASRYNIASERNSTPISNETVDAPDDAPSASLEATPSDSSTPAATAENPKQGSYSYALNLLNNIQNRDVFGSFLLKGIIVNDAFPESSSATIEDLNTNISRIYSLNDTLPDNSQLVDIKQDQVILQKSGIRKRIYFQSGRNNRRRNSASGNSSKGYSKINDNEYNLNPYRAFRGDADRVLDFSMKVSSQDGRMDGIEISDISNNSLAGDLGLRENDVLLAVNKESIDSLLKGINACANAYNSDDLELKIRRGNQVISLNYHLFWEGQGTWTPAEVLSTKAVSSLLKSGLFSNLF